MVRDDVLVREPLEGQAMGTLLTGARHRLPATVMASVVVWTPWATLVCPTPMQLPSKHTPQLSCSQFSVRTSDPQLLPSQNYGHALTGKS